MGQEGYPSKNVQFQLRERVQIGALPCLEMLLGRLIILLPSGPKYTNAPIFLQPPHCECQAPDGAGRFAYVKKRKRKRKKNTTQNKTENCSERIDSK